MKLVARILATIFALIASTAAIESFAADPRNVTIVLRAADNISGVVNMQIAEDRNNPGAVVPFETTTVVNTALNSLWVRIQDRAGNWSAWVEVVVGAEPYQNTPNFSPTPTPTPTAAPQVPLGGGGGGGGFVGGGGGGGGFVIPIPLPETTTAPSETATASASPTPTPTVATSSTPTPTPSVSVTPSPSPTKEVEVVTPKPTVRPDLVRPSAPTVSKVLAPGLSQVSAAQARTAKVSSPAGSSSSVAAASVISASLGSPVAPLVKALPLNSKLTVTIVVGGKTIKLGQVLTSKKGEVILPAISASKAGTYTIAMKSASGKTFYTKVKFTPKK
jgi:hypothetical protein